jgi:hypothetical protein
LEVISVEVVNMTKKMDWYNAYRIVDGTTRRVRYNGGVWHRMGSIDWMPEERREKLWEVEPEEVTVWGACDGNGESHIYSDTPHRPLSEKDWSASDGEWLKLPEDNLFPKDKPIKFVLTPKIKE